MGPEGSDSSRPLFVSLSVVCNSLTEPIGTHLEILSEVSSIKFAKVHVVTKIRRFCCITKDAWKLFPVHLCQGLGPRPVQ